MSKPKQILSDMNPRQWLPYLFAIVLFAILSIAYVSPVLEGKRLVQSDIIKWHGMAKEIVDFRNETGEEALWTNSMFGGMPAFQISVIYANNISNFFHHLMTLWLPRPADMIFLYFIGFFIFLLLLRVNPWIALVGSIAFALSSYHFIIITAGHNSKAVAIGYMAPVAGAVIYTFRGHLAAGGILFALFMGLQLFANHFQITYYLGIILVLYGIFQAIHHIRQKKTATFLRATGVLVAGLIIAIGLNFGNFWSTFSYTSETMRGGGELTIGQEQQTSGLTKEYITNWSYGVHETFSLLIPNVKGGASGPIGANPRAMAAVTPGFENLVANESHYWGNQPITSGPVYVGAVVLFLFFLTLFYLKGAVKYGMLVAIVLSILLSWGKNFMPLTDFFIDHVPGYNKFRAVSMTLVIAGFCIPALAFLGLHKLYREPKLISVKSTAFFTATALTAGLSLIFYIAPNSFFTFFSHMEASMLRELATDEMLAGQVQAFMTQLEQARIAIFRADAMRSFLFAVAAAIVIWLFGSGKLKPAPFVIVLALLVTVDMWTINRRYLNNDHFLPRRRAEVVFPVRPVDQYILQDSDLNFRVLDVAENTFNSSRTSYFHHSIGGYHGAKLQRYQDIIDVHLLPNILEISRELRNQEDVQGLPELLAEMPVINMLNTRYLIYQPDREPVYNPAAFGNAWFVSEYRIVENADEEIQALEEVDLTSTAIVDRRFAHYLQGGNFSSDPNAQVELVHSQPNLLTYRTRSETEQVLVFSEIFYPEGWYVTISGEEASHFRANYILRAMVVPAGEHEITFRFAPRSYHSGKNISLAFSILLVLLMGAYGAQRLYSHYQEKAIRP